MQFLKKIIVKILTIESRIILLKYRPFIVAVTGSVGKTSAKDAVYEVLKGHGKYVRKTEKSMNSEIGLPLTIIGVPNAWHSVTQWLRNIRQGLRLIFGKNKYPDILVVEIGADHPNDIKSVAKWLKPHIAILTKVSDTPVHVEFFNSPEQVFEEKASLIRSVRKNGTAILFADDAKVLSLKGECEKRKVKVITFGTKNEADVMGKDFAFKYVRDAGSRSNHDETIQLHLVCNFNLLIQGEILPMTYRSPLGSSGMYPLLTAAAVGVARGIPVKEIVGSLGNYHAPRGRMNILNGINNSILIDDTYNSSPDAVFVALETLRELTCSGKKIVLLGDMMELGKYSAEEHRKVGAHVARIASMLVTVGQRSRATADEALKSGMQNDSVFHFDTSKEAAEFIMPKVRSNDIVLIKGSQSIRMERVTKILLNESSRSGELLVRQEPEWLEKP